MAPNPPRRCLQGVPSCLAHPWAGWGLFTHCVPAGLLQPAPCSEAPGERAHRICWRCRAVLLPGRSLLRSARAARGREQQHAGSAPNREQTGLRGGRRRFCPLGWRRPRGGLGLDGT